MSDVSRIEKTLSANDVGANGSHQSGFVVPKTMVQFFPSLDESVKNPDCWLTVSTDDGHAETWRYIHYNNKLLGEGTRDEFRVTHCTGYFGRVSAATGDVLVLTVDRRRETLGVELRSASAPEEPNGRLVLSTAGRWRHVALQAGQT